MGSFSFFLTVGVGAKFMSINMAVDAKRKPIEAHYVGNE